MRDFLNTILSLSAHLIESRWMMWLVVASFASPDRSWLGFYRSVWDHVWGWQIQWAMLA